MGQLENTSNSVSSFCCSAVGQLIITELRTSRMGSVQFLVCRTFSGESAVHRVRTISFILRVG